MLTVVRSKAKDGLYKGYSQTHVYQNGKFFCEFPAGQTQPRYGSKTLMLNCTRREVAHWTMMPEPPAVLGTARARVAIVQRITVPVLPFTYEVPYIPFTYDGEAVEAPENPRFQPGDLLYNEDSNQVGVVLGNVDFLREDLRLDTDGIVGFEKLSYYSPNAHYNADIPARLMVYLIQQTKPGTVIVEQV